MGPKSSKYLNRELSWLEFNQRVLDEASDESVPLLERLKFLTISGSNLDEFFMVRVGGLQMLASRGSTKPDPAEMMPDEQLKAVTARARRMVADQYDCYLDTIEPALAAAGIRRIRPETISERQDRALEQVFDDETSAVLTPMAVTDSEDFPLLANQALCLCVQLQAAPAADQEPRFAVIPFGRSIPRFVTLPSDGGYDYMLLEEVVLMHIERFFPGEIVLECVPFRITRNADLGIREDLAADLLSEMEDVLDARKEGRCVRLEILDSATPRLRTFLQRTLEVADADVYALRGPLDLSAFRRLPELEGFDSLRYEAWPPLPSPDVDLRESMFEVLSRRDVMLIHPYESFEPVVRLIEAAADDPDVLAIKQTLYRTSRTSPIVAALARAAERGKSVAAIVELKARFDEARNIEWARNLEQAGVQVIYGVKGLKTHAKICIIVRREPGGIQRYVHFGTGNYNETTARIYSDVSLMTSDEELGLDATAFFNAVTGYSQPQKFRKIEAAPLGLREKFLELIEGETSRKRHGQKARIVAKLNSLVDPQMIDALYAASQAGVKVRLNVRGICCLRPGVEELSENISVVSVVDRFLEHARIAYFYHGGEERVFISSADWMPRNLDRRVELLVPVEDAVHRERLVHILRMYFGDTAKGRRLLSDGSYKRIKAKDKAKKFRSQEAIYRELAAAVEDAERYRATVFEPHRAPGETP